MLFSGYVRLNPIIPGTIPWNQLQNPRVFRLTQGDLLLLHQKCRHQGHTAGAALSAVHQHLPANLEIETSQPNE